MCLILVTSYKKLTIIILLHKYKHLNFAHFTGKEDLNYTPCFKTTYSTHLDGTARCCTKGLLAPGQINSEFIKTHIINTAIEVTIGHINEVMLTRKATKVHGIRYIREELCTTR